MKRKLIVPALIVLLATGGLLTTHALADRGFERHHAEDREGHGDRSEMRHERFERMAEVLDLSDQQRQQIRAIIDSSRQTAEPLREQLHENRQALREAGRADTVDEAKIRALATESGKLQGELAIHRVHTRQQLRAQLTAEQQQLFDKIKPLFDKRDHDGPKHHRFSGIDDDDRDHHGPHHRDADHS